MTKNLVSITPFFIVKDLQASAAFYCARLGFQLDFQGPEGDMYYARVSRDGIGIIRLEHYARCAASTVRVGSAPVHDTSAVGP